MQLLPANHWVNFLLSANQVIEKLASTQSLIRPYELTEREKKLCFNGTGKAFFLTLPGMFKDSVELTIK